MWVILPVLEGCQNGLSYRTDNSDCSIWQKRDATQAFDVSMGAYDGAEICELVGLYALAKLKGRINTSSIGLYRDDGLATLTRASGSRADRARKELINVFKDLGLQITVETNLKVVHYLDVTLDLDSNSYRPYRKPNDTPMYVNAKSDHPPSILKHIPISVEKRISSLSSNQTTFDKAAPLYNEALRKSGYDTSITYNNPGIECTKDKSKTRSNKRRRKVTWFNPPYSACIKTNVARKFLNLITKHFSSGHKLNKIFNKNTVKVSYSCMKNVKSIITGHNRKIIRAFKAPSALRSKTCNCRTKSDCPLRGNCLVKSIVYKATVTHGNTSKVYIGNTGGEFKDRFRNHTKSFNNAQYETETVLSKHIWNLIRSGTHYAIRYDILKQSNTIGRKTGQCNLCLDEKVAIMQHNDLLNKRTEILSKCRHKQPEKNQSKKKKKEDKVKTSIELTTSSLMIA